MPTHDEIFQKVQATLVDALGVDEDDVTPDATLQGTWGPSRSTSSTSSSASSGTSGSRSRGASCSPRTSSDPEMIQDGKLTTKGLTS